MSIAVTSGSQIPGVTPGPRRPSNIIDFPESARRLGKDGA
jgi:hypothetical protein